MRFKVAKKDGHFANVFSSCPSNENMTKASNNISSLYEISEEQNLLL